MTTKGISMSARIASGLAAALVPALLLAQGPRPGGPPPKPLPLDVGRHANFSASKGTWISLDVSPDGRSLVFDLLGDLYTLPIEGGTVACHAIEEGRLPIEERSYAAAG